MAIMTARELIRRYMFFRRGQKIGSQYMDLVEKDGVAEEIKARKLEILEEFDRMEKEWSEEIDDRTARIAEIEGLTEIQNALDDLASWHREFEASFKDVGGLGVRAKPEYDLADMYAKYPRAVAYLKAHEMSLKYNTILNEAGKKALDMVIYGDYHEALKIMADAEKAMVDRFAWN